MHREYDFKFNTKEKDWWYNYSPCKFEFDTNADEESVDTIIVGNILSSIQMQSPASIKRLSYEIS